MNTKQDLQFIRSQIANEIDTLKDDTLKLADILTIVVAAAAITLAVWGMTTTGQLI